MLLTALTSYKAILRLLVSFILAISLSSPAVADEVVIAVLYPEVDRPFDEAYEQILGGMRSVQGSFTIRPHRTRANSLNEVQTWLRSVDPTLVVTLGSRTLELYQQTNISTPLVVGGVEGTPSIAKEHTGVSLTADPYNTFEILRALNPNIQRIMVVHDEEHDQWLMDHAQKSAKMLDLELLTYDAKNMSEASRHFWSIFRYANPETDALWLTTDVRIVDERMNLPLIVEQSWYRDMTVFSNSLAHARQGVLFAVYPDLAQYGKQLLELARELVVSPRRRQEFLHLRSADVAYNSRIGAHLRLNVAPEVRDRFKLIFDGN